jgi:hypothetical protein
MEVKIENNKLQFNIMDLFDNMSEEELKELGTYYMWDSEIYKTLAYEMKQNLAAESYNENFFNLEKAFFIMPDKCQDDDWEQEQFRDDVFHTMKSAVREILKENAKTRIEKFKMSKVIGKAYNWILQNYGSDKAYEFNSMCSSEEYGKPSPYELAESMVKYTDFSKLVEEWVDDMIKKFNPKLQEKKE